MEQFDCHFEIVPTVRTIGETYAVAWTERSLTLDLQLSESGRHQVLWQAVETKRAGDGGLPVSPLAIAGAVYLAAQEMGDRDAWPRLIEDATRAAFSTLPDRRNTSILLRRGEKK